MNGMCAMQLSSMLLRDATLRDVRSLRTRPADGASAAGLFPAVATGRGCFLTTRLRPGTRRYEREEKSEKYATGLAALGESVNGMCSM